MPIPGGFLLTDPNVRHPFGGTPADFVISANSTTKILSGMQATLTMWTQQTGGTRITDLQDASHNPITAVVTDAYGSLPVFYGPADNTNVLWADAGGARAKLLATDIGDRLALLEAGDNTTVIDCGGPS